LTHCYGKNAENSSNLLKKIYYRTYRLSVIPGEKVVVFFFTVVG